jgi:hypothetical protein
MQKYSCNGKKSETRHDHDLTGDFRVNSRMEHHNHSCNDGSSQVCDGKASGTHFPQKISITEGFDDSVRAGDKEKTGKKQNNKFFFARPEIDDAGQQPVQPIFSPLVPGHFFLRRFLA